MDRTDIAVVSDIHGNILALEAVYEDIKRRNIEKVFNLGDHVSGPLWPKETVRFLMPKNWKSILGNQDRRLTQDDPGTHGESNAFAYRCLNAVELDWLSKLPQIILFEDEIMAFHGSPNRDDRYLTETVENGKTHLASEREIEERLDGAGFPVILCGHTHKQRLVRLKNGSTVINPGSVGLPGYADDGGVAHVVENGSPHARYAIVRTMNGNVDVDFISVHYDWGKAADKASEADREDWAKALRSGYMS